MDYRAALPNPDPLLRPLLHINDHFRRGAEILIIHFKLMMLLKCSYDFEACVFEVQLFSGAPAAARRAVKATLWV